MDISSISDVVAFTCCKYGDHDLQRVGIWERVPSKDQGYWLIFIHGGAWRDSRNTMGDFAPSIQTILAAKYINQSDIHGFISIDYRLSPHPDQPQNPAGTPESELRNARHPDHILDVRSALAFLQHKFRLNDKYVLVGHSAGATLAYQCLMGEAAVAGRQMQDIGSHPAAVIGISGIYDLVGLNDRHGGTYDEFLCPAFGSDREEWKAVSPATVPSSFRDTWFRQGYSLLAYSPEDALIDSVEIDSMEAKLKRDGLEVTVIKDLVGDHDFVWQDGSQIGRLVSQVIARLTQA